MPRRRKKMSKFILCTAIKDAIWNIAQPEKKKINIKL